MGALRVIKTGPLSTIQDEGRFGFRQYGIPQSGAMDLEAMHKANYLVGNDLGFPVVETAIQGLILEAIEETVIGVSGAQVVVKINNQEVPMNESHLLATADKLSVSAPINGVYSYLGIGGELRAKEDFGSKSTYLMAGFGGIDGRELKPKDILKSNGTKTFEKASLAPVVEETKEVEIIRIIKGPEWGLLKDSPDKNVFEIDASSNRMGIRLTGDGLNIDGKEITSSAVIPGSIQLPSGGLPIVLMNDCQTTGGYPRIGKVIDKDLGKLAQLKPSAKLSFEVVSFEEAKRLKKS